MILSIVLGVYFIRPAIKLYKSLEDEDALKLMFASFSYLPLIFLFYYLDLLVQVYFINSNSWSFIHGVVRRNMVCW